MPSAVCAPVAGDLQVQDETDHDLEAAQTRVPNTLAAGIRDPLCRLATNKDHTGVQGRWRLIAAIVLCTLFMVKNKNLLAHLLLLQHLLMSSVTVKACAGLIKSLDGQAQRFAVLIHLCSKVQACTSSCP